MLRFNYIYMTKKNIFIVDTTGTRKSVCITAELRKLRTLKKLGMMYHAVNDTGIL